MKNQFAILLLLMFGRLSAQTSFYISPILDTKTYISSTYGQLFNNGFKYSDKVALNPYFAVNNRVMSFRSNIQIGINFGCSLKNGKHLIALGWNQDATGSKMESILMSYSTNKFPEDVPSLNRYSDNGGSFSSILFIQRISFQYSTRISQNTNSPIQLYFITSVGLFFNPHGSNKRGIPAVIPKVYVLSDGTTGATYLDTNTFISRQRHIITPIHRFSSNISIGFSVDFKTRQKNKYLFSASVNYLQGFRVLESTSHEYTINDSGKLNAYSYETVSKGSGVYLQVFRRFNIHPRKIRLKK